MNKTRVHPLRTRPPKTFSHNSIVPRTTTQHEALHDRSSATGYDLQTTDGH